LLQALRAQRAALEWGDAAFTPQCAAEVLAVRKGERLWLCDTEARDGAFDVLETACRRLGLSYQRHTEAACGEDGVRVDWRPGMRTPLARPASNEGEAGALIPEKQVRAALTLLQTGHTAKGIAVLRQLCPDVPEIPPLVLT
jgi:hypothetical protein